MRVAVLSDLHDNLTTWALIPKELKASKAEAMLFLGDMCSPAVMVKVAEDFSGPIFLVFGNVDGDKPLMLQRASEFDHLHVLGERGEVELEGKRFFLTHYPDIARAFAKAGGYDAVCYGHDHIQHKELVGSTLLLNPGTAGGVFQYPSYALVETETLTVEFKRPKL